MEISELWRGELVCEFGNVYFQVGKLSEEDLYGYIWR